MEFHKIGDGGGPFVKTGGDEEGQIRAVSASGIDSKVYTTSFIMRAMTTPLTLVTQL